MKFIKNKHIILICLCLYLLFFICADLTFRNDESFTLALIKHNIFDVIRLDSFDVHPPLFYLLLKLFIDISTFWTSSVFYKIISARLFSLITFFIGFYFLRKILINLNINNDYMIQLLLILLFPSVLFFSTQIRMYSTAGMFLVLEFYELDKFDRLSRNKYLMYATIWCVLAAYTHYFTAVSSGMFLIIFCIKYLVKRNIKFIKLVISGFILILLYIPWLMYSLPNLRSNMSINSSFTLKNIIRQLLRMIFGFSGISDSSINSYGNIVRISLAFIIFLFIAYMCYWSLHNINFIFNERLFEVDIVFLVTSLIGVIIQLLGIEYSPRFIYPIFFINSFFILNIFIIYEEKCKYINIVKMVKILFCIIIFIFFVFSTKYSLVNLNKSIDTYRVILYYKKYNKIYLRNKNKSALSFNRSQPLICHNHQFYLTNNATYLYYMNKKLLTNKIRPKIDFTIEPNGNKIGKRIWPNIYINHKV